MTIYNYQEYVDNVSDDYETALDNMFSEMSGFSSPAGVGGTAFIQQRPYGSPQVKAESIACRPSNRIRAGPNRFEPGLLAVETSLKERSQLAANLSEASTRAKSEEGTNENARS